MPAGGRIWELDLASETVINIGEIANSQSRSDGPPGQPNCKSVMTCGCIVDGQTAIWVVTGRQEIRVEPECGASQHSGNVAAGPGKSGPIATGFAEVGHCAESCHDDYRNRESNSGRPIVVYHLRSNTERGSKPDYSQNHHGPPQLRRRPSRLLVHRAECFR